MQASKSMNTQQCLIFLKLYALSKGMDSQCQVSVAASQCRPVSCCEVTMWSAGPCHVEVPFWGACLTPAMSVQYRRQSTPRLRHAHKLGNVPMAMEDPFTPLYLLNAGDAGEPPCSRAAGLVSEQVVDCSQADKVEMVLLPLKEACCGGCHVRYDVLHIQQQSLMLYNPATDWQAQLMLLTSKSPERCWAVLLIDDHNELPGCCGVFADQGYPSEPSYITSRP